MIIEKVPSLTCGECGSAYVIKTKDGIECDDCGRITAQTSDLMKFQQDKTQKQLTLNFMEINNEVTSNS